MVDAELARRHLHALHHLLELPPALTYKFAGDHASADALIAQLRQSSKSVI